MKTKPLFIVIVLATMAFSFSQKANSQVLISLLLGDKLNSEKLKFGLDGGVNFSTISNIDPSKYMTGWNLGFYFDFLLKENTHWYLHTGVLVKSTLGTKGMDTYSLDEGGPLDSLFGSGSIERRLNYFNVPILIRYKFKNELFIEAGANLGLLYKAHDVFYAEVNEKEDLSFSLENRDLYNRIDAGVEAGIGYQVMKGTGYNFGFRYYYGLTNTIKDSDQKNSCFYLFASLPVGAGEKAKAKAEAKKKEKEEKKALKEEQKKQ